jgi:hypothetical protein
MPSWSGLGQKPAVISAPESGLLYLNQRRFLQNIRNLDRHAFRGYAGLVQGEGFAVDASVIEANASRYHGKAPDEIDWSQPERQTRAVAKFLTALDDEGSDADRKPPKVISPVDPCSAWTAKANKRVQFGYAGRSRPPFKPTADAVVPFPVLISDETPTSRFRKRS